MQALAASLALVFLGVAAVGAQNDDRPLPDADTFLARARERVASNEALQERYTFKERSTDLKLNPFGRIGSGPPLLYQVYPAVDPEMTYRRLIARDGVPLSPDELEREDRAYRRRYEAWRRSLAREDEDDRAARRREQAENAAKLRAQAEEVLQLFTFTIDRRDDLGGEPAIVVRFAAKPDATPKSREARVAVAFVGQVWIHEREHEVMRLEARAIKDVAFGFGMVARLHEGAATSVTRRRVKGVWLPAETRFTGTGRALLFRKVTINYVRQFFDYRPYDPTGPPPIAGLASPGNR